MQKLFNFVENQVSELLLTNPSYLIKSNLVKDLDSEYHSSILMRDYQRRQILRSKKILELEKKELIKSENVLKLIESKLANILRLRSEIKSQMLTELDRDGQYD